MMKSGFVSITGLANAGKSTLINSLVGEKVAIVTFRPQTTRDRILGIYNGDGCQIAFVDTPGIHKPHNKLGEYMARSAESAVADCDAVIYVIDAVRGVCAEDEEFLHRTAAKHKTVVALNKDDAVARETLFASLKKLNAFPEVCAVVPVSAKKKQNLPELLSEVVKLLPEGEKLYPDDMYTDKSVNYLVGEIIREKTMHLLDKEIPYGIGIDVARMAQRVDANICDIDADIVCERQSHKAIIIGKGGAMLKEIASRAREEIEKFLDTKVFLTLFVKVEEDWRQNQYLIKGLGYKD